MVQLGIVSGAVKDTFQFSAIAKGQDPAVCERAQEEDVV